MTDLIERLEAAEAGSRELDEAVWLACGQELRISGPVNAGKGVWSGPHVSHSLDAALALAERLGMNGPCELHRSGVQEWGFHFEDTDTAYSRTPAMSVCIAVLRAFEGRAK